MPEQIGKHHLSCAIVCKSFEKQPGEPPHRAARDIPIWRQKWDGSARASNATDLTHEHHISKSFRPRRKTEMLDVFIPEKQIG